MATFLFKSLAKFPGIFVNHSRVVLQRSKQHVGSIQQAYYLSVDHPGLPKKPLSSYMLFVSDERPQVVAENPDLTLTEIAKKIGAMWQKLPDQKKEEYKSKYKVNAERYKEELADFKASISTQEWEEIETEKKKKRTIKKKRKKKLSKKKRLKDLGMPENTRGTVIGWFIKDQKVSGVKKLLPEYIEEWNQLSKDEQQVYKDKYKKASEEYKVVLEKWKDEMVAEGHKELLEELNVIKTKKPVKKKKKSAAEKKSTKEKKSTEEKKSTDNFEEEITEWEGTDDEGERTDEEWESTGEAEESTEKKSTEE